MRAQIGAGVLDAGDDAELAGDALWQASNYGQFESFIRDFLVDGGEGRIWRSGFCLWDPNWPLVL